MTHRTLRYISHVSTASTLVDCIMSRLWQIACHTFGCPDVLQKYFDLDNGMGGGRVKSELEFRVAAGALRSGE